MARAFEGFRPPASWIAVLALAAAGAAFAFPGPAGDITGIATVLGMSAIALFAGHAWALPVVAVAKVMLLGKVWPIVGLAVTSGDTWMGIAAVGALVAALPGLLIFIKNLPQAVDLILGRSPARVRRLAISASAIAAAVWLVLPAITA